MLREALDALRNPAGAVRLAVQILAGPLRSAIRESSSQDADRVCEVLDALEAATAELTRLLTPAAVGVGVADMLVPRDTAVSPEALVAAVCQSVRARCQLSATIETSVEPGTRPVGTMQDLQIALTGLVENAMESMARRRPGCAPWTVELSVAHVPSESDGKALHVAFDVRDRGDGLPAGVRRWLEDPSGASPEGAPSGPGMSLQFARRVAEGSGGRLLATRVGGTTRIRLRVPQR